MPRTPGSKAKIPQTVKENIQAVFIRLGGTAAMADWARKNQTDFYKIYARMLPADLAGENNAPFTIQIIKFSDQEVLANAIDVVPEQVLLSP